ncbi:acyl-CoA ligase (AMP-forming) (exosortase A-associated) [Antricoccus suffuscus]|uniref:Acyl-CoA ligase (AMP-forming) (Exosortase A-associated) n=1 Tax=Antricoccus suffuscus TaxID=1629062 RepID=A0A2T1A1K2_9ACTN|nr:acyl-CoA ligase (AMP-forming), exosortase A system-associated [Antricoccus suffuscus]PRZ42489.1 acyl-CoA ligase (AMP-forming) (exosortase A-associated) [Antricoccus suffuscus]
MQTNLHHLIEHRATSNGDAPALTFKDTTFTYAELWAQTQQVAAGLARLGLRSGDRVGVFLDKRIETVTSIFGSSAASAVFVPVNPLLKPAQVVHILNDCDVRVLVTTPERLALLADDLKECDALSSVILVATGITPKDAPDLGDVDVHQWSVVFDNDGSSSQLRSAIDLDIAAILYTSGSTGRPKGVVLSHRNLIVGAESVSQYLGNTADDVILAALPLSFDAGFSQLTTAFSAGAHVILMNYLLPRDVVRLCEKHSVTGLTCVPPLWIQIAAQEWPPAATENLRYFANTGGRMPRTTLDKLRDQFPAATPYLMYGLTEAFRSTYLDPAEIDRRPDSIGKAIPNAEVMVVRPDGSPCDFGEEGELVHRGALVALGYWNDPERTAERFRPVPGRNQDWRSPEVAVFSGDAVVTDNDGFLYFVGRKDEMIKTSGYRVSPTEVEEAAYSTGLVRDVVALGVDDATLGQKILLVVSPSGSDPLDEAALIAAMRHRLPLFMVPSSVVTRSAIPRTPNGKFDRKLLREEVGA